MTISFSRSTSAFTLIEVLVIAPIIILFIGAFIGLIVGLTGDSLQTRANNEVAYSVQNAIDVIEAANGRSTEAYPSTTGTLTSPQGVNNTTTAFTVTNNDTSATDNDVLIIKTPATTHDPINPDRSIIRYNSPNACNASNVSSNPYYPVTLVYFVSGGSLWQRTILPSSGTPCIEPWQKTSCAESQSLTGVCKTYDDELAENVSSFSVKYFDKAGAAVGSADPSTATTIEISIKSDKTVAGKTITYTGKVRSSLASGVSIAELNNSHFISMGYSQTYFEYGRGTLSYACAIAEGTLNCWGDNGAGELGQGNQSNTFNTPAIVGGVLSGKTVTRVATSGSLPQGFSNNGDFSTTCAIATNNLYCWGGGVGNEDDLPGIVNLSGRTVTAIKMSSMTGFEYGLGLQKACAVASGYVYCWGGQHANAANGSTPQVMSGSLAGKIATDVEVVAAMSGDNSFDYSKACAIAEANLHCWDLGVFPSAPSQISGPFAGKVVTQVSLANARNMSVNGSGNSATYSRYFGCAIASSELYCWGDNSAGQLGTGNYTQIASPSNAVKVGGALAGKSVSYVTTVGVYSYDTSSDGSDVNASRTCAIADGALYCWGGGNGVSAGSTTPQLIAGGLSGKTVSQVSMAAAHIAGGSSIRVIHTCAVADNQLYCWGNNTAGQIGDGTTTARDTPTLITGALAGKKITGVDTSASLYEGTYNDESQSCAIADGSLYCWGGQFGSSSNVSSPQLVAGSLSGKTIGQ